MLSFRHYVPQMVTLKHFHKTANIVFVAIFVCVTTPMISFVHNFEDPLFLGVSHWDQQTSQPFVPSGLLFPPTFQIFFELTVEMFIYQI
jgi:hypothetical protein